MGPHPRRPRRLVENVAGAADSEERFLPTRTAPSVASLPAKGGAGGMTAVSMRCTIVVANTRGTSPLSPPFRRAGARHRAPPDLLWRSAPGGAQRCRPPRGSAIAAGNSRCQIPARRGFRLEQADFLKSPELRRAVHVREIGLRFCCRKCLTPSVKCLDHFVLAFPPGVVPTAI
jgi:hypothetical protein